MSTEPEGNKTPPTILERIKPILSVAADPEFVKSMADADTVLPDFGITTVLRERHFLAQVLHETDGLRVTTENMSYSPNGLMGTWPTRFPSYESARPYARNPKDLAVKVYGGRMGNAPFPSSDGWVYRGHGMLQHTGRETYAALTTDLGADFVLAPELVNSAAWALKCACWEWQQKNCNDPADDDDIERVTRKINGGLIGIESRKRWFAKLAILEA